MKGEGVSVRNELLNRTSTSLGQLFRDRVAETPDDTAFLVPDYAPSANTWIPITWQEAQSQVDELAAGLICRGVKIEQRVAIVCSTRIEWVLSDLAIACSAGATTTVYPNTHAEEVGFIVSDSHSVVVIAENKVQVEKIQANHNLDDQVHTIVVIDPDGVHLDSRVITFTQLAQSGREYLAKNPKVVDQAINSTNHQSLATLIYTSGTTGKPKGVRLNHLCWLYQGVAMDSMDFVRKDDLHYLWLPLSHVFGKCLISVALKIGFTTAIDGRVDRIVEGLSEVKPTLMCGAPRIFEKVRSAVMTQTRRNKLTELVSRWAFAIGRDSRPYRLSGKPMPRKLAIKYQIADKLVFSKLKNKMGGRIRFFISGSAKLSSQVQEWFFSAGLIVVEGYGLTETTAIAFVNHPENPHFGTVGQVTPGIEMKIAADGEILVRGPIVSQGYENLSEITKKSFTDGWFHTGDIGKLDEHNCLVITDRKKDLIKTSGGKFVAPQKVESAILANIPYVSQAVAVGEGHKYIAALVTLDKDSLKRWGANHGKGHLTYAELSQEPAVRASIARWMKIANLRLQKWETVKRFAILDHELTVESSEITPNMKIRRRFVLQRNSKIVDSLYYDEDE